ncbi:MAG TPA: S53 family peptidase [Streptosporangiaceae bacterium]|nr:S53 family peptidase [Streptosporangiaceae bacterium]
MSWKRLAVLGIGVTFAVAMAVSAGGAAALAAPAAHAVPAAAAAKSPNHPTFVVHRIGTRSNGTPLVTSKSPTGLPPSAIQSVYNLSGLSPTSGAGAGQIIAIIDAYNDANALSDLNVFNAEYGYASLSTCTSLSQSGPCFEVAEPSGKPSNNSDWALEESLDIEWAHAEAPAAKIVLVEAKTSSNANLYAAVDYANTTLDANVVSMSWGGSETSSETSSDSNFTHAGTLYTASAGDSGHGVIYPSASPDVIAVGGTTLNGCSGTSCAGFTSETTWSDGGGGISKYESIPAYQSSYTGPVYGASTISALTGGKRGVPDVSFVGNPNTGVSVYDSTAYDGQSGWWTIGGTSVGAPNWAGILAAGNAAGSTALQGNTAIYGGGYKTNLRDITSGTNGSCGTDCTAGTGYDLVTGLGSPINYP